VTEALPVIYLARHGETAWRLWSQHTGRTDLPLTKTGATPTWIEREHDHP